MTGRRAWAAYCVAVAVALLLGYWGGYRAGYNDAKAKYRCHVIGGGSAVGPGGKQGAYVQCLVRP